MELNTIDEIFEIIYAYKEGKEIEWMWKTDLNWKLLTVPNFNFCDTKYRIKQKEKKKVKYYQYYCKTPDRIYLSTVFFKTLQDCKNYYDSHAFKACESTAIEVEEED